MEQPYSDYPPRPPRNTHSQGFGLASMILGSIGIATGCCAYPSIICGALSIIFALLSRGGAMTFSDRSKIGLGLGIASVSLGVLMLVVSLVTVIYTFGSLDAYMEYYMELLQQIDPTYQQNIFQ